MNFVHEVCAYIVATGDVLCWHDMVAGIIRSDSTQLPLQIYHIHHLDVSERVIRKF